MKPKTTLVETMARAIEPETFELPRINLNKPVYDRAYARALAALAAMREPTPKMLQACAGAMAPDKRPVPGRVSVKNKHRIRYRAMIDAAIAEAAKL